MEILIDEVTRSPLEELESSFLYKETIASGSFGTVIRAIQLSNNQEVAIKILNKDSRRFDSIQIKQEISILKQLNHPNIVEFLSYTETNSKLYIIMEYIASGTLQNWIDQHKGPVTETEASIILEQLISAVAYLHSKDICHRDIKPDNIMFNDKNDVKLIDFGLSANNFDGCEEYDYCGTFIYMAPEQIEKKSYSKYVDLWSIGIVMFLILNNGKHPFFVQGDHKRTYIQKIKNSVLKMVNQISKMAERLLRALLEPNPNLRIKAKNALAHPWVTRSMYDPIPLNYYQSLTHASISKKMKQAMIAALFLNHFSKENNWSNDKLIISDQYIEKIKEENSKKNELLRKEREKSFEVAKPKDDSDLKCDYEETNQSLVITPNKIKLAKTNKKKDTFPQSNSNKNQTPIKKNSNQYLHHKGYSESKDPVSLKPPTKKTLVKESPSFVSLNSLTTQKSNRKDYSVQKMIMKNNANVFKPIQRDNVSPTKAKLIILPKISSEPYIDSTSFPQSLRDSRCNHHNADFGFSPLRSRKLSSIVKKESDNHNNSIPHSNGINISLGKDSTSRKSIKVLDYSSPVTRHKNPSEQAKPIYLPNINRQSPSKRRLVILSNNLIIES